MDREVDVLGGELRAMLDAGSPATFPPTGIDAAAEKALELPDVLTSSIVVIPYGYLRKVPFHALPAFVGGIDDGTVERVTYLPAAGLLRRPPLAAGLPERALFVGHDAAGEMVFDDEIDHLRSYVPEVTVLVGDDATGARVLAELGTHDFAHFACHGDLDPSVAAGYLQLRDGPLYPWHVLAHRAPRTVVVNACLGMSVERIEVTSDGAIGLQDAFLVSGADHVVGGLWEVNEYVGTRFSESFYRLVAAGRDVAAAVVSAQRELRLLTKDPFCWAPHACFGSPHRP